MSTPVRGTPFAPHAKAFSADVNAEFDKLFGSLNPSEGDGLDGENFGDGDYGDIKVVGAQFLADLEHGYLGITGADNSIAAGGVTYQDVVASVGVDLAYTTVTAGVFEVTASLIVSMTTGGGTCNFYGRLVNDGAAQPQLVRYAATVPLGATFIGTPSQTWQVTAGAGKIIKVQGAVDSIASVATKVLAGSALAVKRIA
jgi:hypothetical protein